MHGIRTRFLYDKLVEADIPCPEPNGAFYLFPSFRKWEHALAKRSVRTCDDLALYLLEHYELATLPGVAFGSPPQDLCLRLSSSYLDAGTDEKALALVETFKENPDPQHFIENYHPRLREVGSRFAQFVADLERDRKQKRPSGSQKMVLPSTVGEKPVARDDRIQDIHLNKPTEDFDL
jgi:hypothetical protein